MKNQTKHMTGVATTLQEAKELFEKLDIHPVGAHHVQYNSKDIQRESRILTTRLSNNSNLFKTIDRY